METVVHTQPQTSTPKPVVPVLQNPVLKKVLPTRISNNLILTIVLVVVVVMAGVGTGWLLSGGRLGSGSTLGMAAPGAVEGKNEAGIGDEATFKDSAEGKLEEGGIDGEGTHHLVRDGGPSQNVYLTSTVIDLGSFTGKKVKVWGQTISARKAGWLMDVGKIKVIE